MSARAVFLVLGCAAWLGGASSLAAVLLGEVDDAARVAGFGLGSMVLAWLLFGLAGDHRR